jgi:hypothetical protein
MAIAWIWYVLCLYEMKNADVCPKTQSIELQPSLWYYSYFTDPHYQKVRNMTLGELHRSLG